MFVDDLAQEIRSVNSNGALGASALAEALAPFILNRLSMAEAAPSETAEGELEELCNSWFQAGTRPPVTHHYDVTDARRAHALRLGASQETMEEGSMRRKARATILRATEDPT